MNQKRLFAKTLLAGALSLALGSGFFHRDRSVRAADNDDSTVGGSGPLKDELDPATRTAVDKGLSWLSKNLTTEGTIATADGNSAAIISLAGIAFLAHGDMPGDGQYGKEVDRILDFVLKNCRRNPGLSPQPNYGSPMYGHGFVPRFSSPRPTA